MTSALSSLLHSLLIKSGVDHLTGRRLYISCCKS